MVYCIPVEPWQSVYARCDETSVLPKATTEPPNKIVAPNIKRLLSQRNGIGKWIKMRTLSGLGFRNIRSKVQNIPSDQAHSHAHHLMVLIGIIIFIQSVASACQEIARELDGVQTVLNFISCDDTRMSNIYFLCEGYSARRCVRTAPVSWF